MPITTKLGLKLVDGRGPGAQSPDTAMDGGQLYDIDYNAQHIDDLAGSPNGLATLDGTGKVPSSQIPGGGGGGAPTFTSVCGEDIPANAFVCVVDTGDGHGISLHKAGAANFQIACGFVTQAYTTGQTATVQASGIVTQPFTGSDFTFDSDEGFVYAYLKADNSGFAIDGPPPSPANMQQQLGPVIAIDNVNKLVTIVFDGNGTNSESVLSAVNPGNFQATSAKGTANGYAGLDGGANVPPDQNAYTLEVHIDVSAGGLFSIPANSSGAGIYKLTGSPSIAVVFQIMAGSGSRAIGKGPFTIINATGNDFTVGIAGPQTTAVLYTIPGRAQQTFTCSGDVDTFSLAPTGSSVSRIAGMNNVAIPSGSTTTGFPMAPNEKRTVLFTTGNISGTGYDLPSATGCSGAQIWLKKVDSGSGVATINAQSGENIEGSGSKTLAAQWKYLILESLDNGVWGIFGSN